MGIYGRLGSEKDRCECGYLKEVDHDHGHLLDLDVRGLACFHEVLRGILSSRVCKLAEL